MNTANFAKNVTSALSKIDGKVVKIDDITKTNNTGFARVVATIPNTLASNATNAVQALERHFGNKMRVVSNTFAVTASSAATTTVTGIMTANIEAVAYTPDMDGFRSVSGNMFLDDEDSAWTLRTTSSGQVLIRARTQADSEVIDDMMTSVSSSVVGTSSYDGLRQVALDDNMRNSLGGNDFVVFVNPTTAEVAFGAIACEIVDGDDSQDLCIVAAGSDDHVRVDRRMVLSVVEAHDIEVDDSEIYQESTSSSGHSLDEIVNYYRQVFQRNLGYFEKFITLWKNHSFQ
jgi:hypothetical protein